MEASASASAPGLTWSSAAVRSWRTTFLSLRDEVLASPTTTTLVQLLNRLIFSQSETLMAATSNIPDHEVTSDAMFLLELARTISHSGGNDDVVHALLYLSNLIQNFCRTISFKMTSTTWSLVLDTSGGMMKMFLGTTGVKRDLSRDIVAIEAAKQCLETVRCIVDVNQRTIMLSADVQLLNFLLRTVSYSQAALAPCFSSGFQGCTTESGKKTFQSTDLWEIQTTAFTMIGEVFSRVGASLPADHWQIVVDAFRNIMDVLASKGLLVESIVMDRFYTSLLRCLHLVLVNAKGSLHDHVAGFVAALRIFFNYGLTSKSQNVFPIGVPKKDIKITSVNSQPAESIGPYRPPHMRKKNQKAMQSKNFKILSILDHPPTTMDYMSSDSDLSDSDGSAKDSSNFQSSKARVAAIVCIQDLCRSDPKSFTAQWTILLPSCDVLQARRYEANLMTCLLFDPYLKARIASASTLATMLEGPASVFLQVAEYKESTKLGSFTALSSSLGQILMQVHTGILYLIRHEKSSGLLVSLFKVLTLLIACTPYSRMPAELLPTVILNLHERIVEGFPIRGDQTGLLVVALNCLTTALSISPSPKVFNMFMVELSTGIDKDRADSGLLSTMFHYSQPFTSPTVSIEALQVLKAVAHNYPNIMVDCWKQVSSIVCEFLDLPLPEVSSRMRIVNSGHTVATIEEKVITAAIKLLDECLRAICGFKGTEDHSDGRLLGSPFTSDYIKIKTISSAPSYGSESQQVDSDEHPSCSSGSQKWCEAIEKQLPSTLFHGSAMVRAASITCFAGITSSVFFSLPEEKQDRIITYSINAALNDEVPSVRSAACRAVGVVACFPQVFESVEILHNFIHAAEVNSHHSLVSVRIPASWALANLCDSLRHCIDRFTSARSSVDLNDFSRMISLLIDCSLRLTQDGDKIKANAVRALGNLSRFLPCSDQDGHDEQKHDTNLDQNTEHAGNFPVYVSRRNERCLASKSVLQSTWGHSHWLEKMVQAFLSCVTTGNVKVQWNVCHALSNLFLNETLKLQYADWAPSVFSILLLLLRDSLNFKIRIQAAAALAAPPTILDYGKSYSDVLQGVEHILENLGSDQMYAPSSFKYRIALEKQITSTMLHVLGLISGANHHPVQDFLIKKASFLEEWLRLLCVSLVKQVEAEDDDDDDSSSTSTWNQKKEVIDRAIGSLVKVYEARNQHAIAQRFNKLMI